MRRIKLLGIFLVLWSPAALAAIPIDSSKVLHLKVSDRGLTRISIENDRIRDMFAYPASEEIQLHGSGHLFIAPSDEKGPLFVSIITASGKNQDMNLEFTRKKAEPIVLNVPKKERTSKTQISRWMEAALVGDLPHTFRPQSLREEPRYTKNAVAREDARFLGSTHVISLWEVSLRGKSKTSLRVRDFLNSDEAGKFSMFRMPESGKRRLVTIRTLKGRK